MSAKSSPSAAARRADVKTGPTEPLGECTGSSAVAPFVCFDFATAWGLHDGVATVTLEALRIFNTSGGVEKNFVITAHLKMGMEALAQLRSALDAIELLQIRSVAGRPN